MGCRTVLVRGGTVPRILRGKVSNHSESQNSPPWNQSDCSHRQHHRDQWHMDSWSKRWIITDHCVVPSRMKCLSVQGSPPDFFKFSESERNLKRIKWPQTEELKQLDTHYTLIHRKRKHNMVHTVWTVREEVNFHRDTGFVTVQWVCVGVCAVNEVNEVNVGEFQAQFRSVSSEYQQ